MASQYKIALTIFVAFVIFSINNFELTSGFSRNIQRPLTNGSVSFGFKQPADTLLRRTRAQKFAMSGRAVYTDVSYRGAPRMRISYIHAIETGLSQNATVRVISGGLSQNNATVRIVSDVGKGFDYNIEFYGHNTMYRS